MNAIEFKTKFQEQVNRLHASDEISVELDDNNVRFAWSNTDQPWSRIAKTKYDQIIAGLNQITTIDHNTIDNIERVLCGKTIIVPANVWDGR